jgi:hypothetical protein
MAEIKRTTPNVKLTKSAEEVSIVKKNTTIKVVRGADSVQLIKKEGRTIVKTQLESVNLTRKNTTVKINTPALQGIAWPAWADGAEWPEWPQWPQWIQWPTWPTGATWPQGEQGVPVNVLLSNYVSYTGANANVALGAFNLTSTRIFTGLGTALLPAYSFTGDTNTGMWSPTADTLAWSTNGVERMRLTSTGRLGIGTTTPTVGAIQATGGDWFSTIPPYWTASIGSIKHSPSGWNGSGFLFTNTGAGSNGFSMVFNNDQAYFGVVTASSAQNWMQMNGVGMNINNRLTIGSWLGINGGVPNTGSGYYLGINGAIQMQGSTCGFELEERSNAGYRYQHYANNGFFRIWSSSPSSPVNPRWTSSDNGDRLALDPAGNLYVAGKMDSVSGFNTETPATITAQSETPYTYSYTLSYLPVQAGSITGTDSNSNSITDDGGGNINSISSGGNTEYVYTYSYTLAFGNIVPSTISGSSSYGGSIYDDGYGNISDSYYGQIATIDYVTGIVTDTTYGYITTNIISYNYSILTLIATIDYVTGIVTDATSGSIYTASINYNQITGAHSSQILPNGNGLFTGSVGIGTTTPSYRLHTVGDSSNNQLVRFESSATDYTAFSVSNTTQTSNASFYMTVAGSSGGTLFGMTSAGFSSLEVNSDVFGVIGNRWNAPLHFGANDTVHLTMNPNGNIFLTDGAIIDNTGTNNLSIETNNRNLHDGASVLSIDWLGRTLHNSLGLQTLDYSNRICRDASSVTSFHWGSRYLADTSNNQTFKWGTANTLLVDNARLQGFQGTDVASANNLVLGSGNVFEITGTTQVNLISNTNWQNGSQITLLFTSTPTVKHNQATSGANTTIQLAGAIDFVATAGDTLTLMMCEIGGTRAWREISRAII